MLDLHNHILPGVDDGAANLTESLEIARQLVSEGVATVVATPHFDPERDRVRISDVQHRVKELQEALDTARIGLTVVPGQEIYLTPDLPSLLQRQAASPLGAGPCVLVEVSLWSHQAPVYLDDTLFRLQVAGYTPVLAHPERYPFVQQDVTTVEHLVERGAVLQLTAPSLLGEYGKRIQRTAENLLRRALYGIASSDRHHPGPNRSLATLDNQLARLAGADVADLLLRTNPARVLRGESYLQVEPRAARRRSVFGQIFRRNL